MPTDRAIHISKSKYLAGLQCPKLLWTWFNDRDLIPEPAPSQQHIFDTGHLIGDLAKELYPGGKEVPMIVGTKDAIELTVTATQDLIKRRRPIFEASFLVDARYCRVDILVPVPGEDGDRRSGNAWDLIEVKSSTRVKDVNINDVAFQYDALTRAGLDLNRLYLMHINTSYVRGDSFDVSAIFPPRGRHRTGHGPDQLHPRGDGQDAQRHRRPRSRHAHRPALHAPLHLPPEGRVLVRPAREQRDRALLRRVQGLLLAGRGFLQHRRHARLAVVAPADGPEAGSSVGRGAGRPQGAGRLARRPRVPRVPPGFRDHESGHPAVQGRATLPADPLPVLAAHPARAGGRARTRRVPGRLVRPAGHGRGSRRSAARPGRRAAGGRRRHRDDPRLEHGLRKRRAQRHGRTLRRARRTLWPRSSTASTT